MSGIIKNILSILIIFISVSSVFAQNDIKIIVNKSNTVDNLSEKEVSDLFLKKKLYWKDKMKANPVDQGKDSKTRNEFSKKIHGKSSAAINAYWQKQIFAGRNVPPPEKQSDSTVIEYVKNNKGAIGYVSASAKTNGVKEISIK
jgi:ABC-type phosphate transport system substrate-binding protein